MPIGIISNCLAVAVGGLLGAAFGNKLSSEFKDKLNLIFGICALGIGINSVILMENMPAVVLALILGVIVGMVLHLEERIAKAGAAVQKMIPGAANMDDAASALLVTTIVLFCSSGTGIYGAIVEGMSGEHTILIAKAILDVFTALIFACTLGAIVSVVAIPQFAVFMVMFLCARLIFPLTTPAMVNDFKACGGLIMVATGLRIAGIKRFPIADMIPAMVLVWFTSALWINVINPLMAGM